MKALNRKLLRDLWGLRGAALAIAMVIAGGVATFVMAVSSLDALQRSQARFYAESGFADVFARLKRAPLDLQEAIAAIPGVERVETRVVAAVHMEVPDFGDPVTGLLVSLPPPGAPALNRVHLVAGELPGPDRDDQVIASEAFMEAHALHPGDRVQVVIRGRMQRLTISGVGLSPEFIYQIKPGDVFPDHRRYAILWMPREPLATAYDMDGAFNDVSLTLQRGAREADVIDRVDALLERYGGLGAHGREHQLSHHYLSQEFRQLRTSATLFPLIFMTVAAFLLAVVVDRLIGTQREQIATLRAFGYRDLQVGLHYAGLVLLIVLLGAALGVGLGAWLGRALSGVYQEFFRFPFLDYRIDPGTVGLGFLIAAAAALLGTGRAVRRAMRLPPAEAMRPEAPATFRPTLVERFGLGRFVAEPTRIILRNLERRAVKSLLTVVGISMAVAIVMTGGFQGDAVDFLVHVQFRVVQRDDVAVTFSEPTSLGARHELEALPGVHHVEPYRLAPVRLLAGHREYRTAITGITPAARLRRLVDVELRAIEPPPRGLLITDYLADYLQVRPGERVTVEVLEGSRAVRDVPVAGTVREFVGLNAYMGLDALNDLLRDGPALSGAYLAVDPAARQGVLGVLRGMPRVAGVALREASMTSLYDTIGDTLLVFAFVNTLLAASIAFGVVYNSARISLAERSRELASLRVLGFTRGEIAYILIGELMVLTLAALPVGMLIGRALCEVVAAQLQSELYRIPLVLLPGTYAQAAAVVLGSALVSAAILYRRLARLDLVAVLKARE